MMANLKQVIRQRYFSHIGGDFIGGLLAAIVALPMALAFGVASGVGAEAGLYGAIACGFFAAMFGGTPGQVSGPTGPMTVVAAGLLVQTGSVELLFFAIVLAGILQVTLAGIKAGDYIHYIPYPVVSGFMSGIGFIIIGLQILPLIGFPVEKDVLQSLEDLPPALANPNWQAFGIGALTLAVIYGLPKFTRKIPSALVALIAGTSAAVAMNLQIPVIGTIPTGLPQIHWPSIHHLIEFHVLLTAAITLAILGAIDSLLTSVVADKITGSRHDSNQELIGQGIGNIVAGFIGGIPGAGATMRTVVNIQANGKTYLSGMVHGAILLAIILIIPPIASAFNMPNPVELIPLSCLAGILISVGISIIDYRGMKSIFRAPKADTAVMLTVLLLTVFVDLIVAVGIGISLASILFVKKLSDSKTSLHGDFESWFQSAEIMANAELEAHVQKSIYVYSFNGPLFFGEAKNFNSLLSKLFQYKYVILHFANAPMVDQTGAYALEDSIRQLQKRGIHIYIVNMTSTVEQVLTNFNIFEHLGLEKHRYQNFDEALAQIRKLESASTSEEKPSKILER